MPGIDITFEQLLYLVIGGIGTIAGPLVGTLTLVGISQQLQGVQQYRFLIFGPMLVLLVIFFPHGIAGAFNRLTAYFARKPAAVAAAEPEAAVR